MNVAIPLLRPTFLHAVDRENCTLIYVFIRPFIRVLSDGSDSGSHNINELKAMQKVKS